MKAAKHPITTEEVLRARGAKSRRTLRLDRLAGLWKGIEPIRVGLGPASTDGVPLRWPQSAIRRARAIATAQADLEAAGVASQQLRVLIAERLRESGHL